jgi:hypothetical protein
MTSIIKKGAVVWDNKFIAAYGLTKIKGDDKIAKTDDRLELNSLWGKSQRRLLFVFLILKPKWMQV